MVERVSTGGKLTTLEQDRLIVQRALELAEAIPDKPEEPIRDLLVEDGAAYCMGPESSAFDELAGVHTGAVRRTASALRQQTGRTDKDHEHAVLLSVGCWENTAGHGRSRLKLIKLLNELLAFLRSRIDFEEELAGGRKPSRRVLPLRSWDDLTSLQKRIVEFLAEAEPGIWTKSLLIAAALGVNPNTVLTQAGRLCKSGFLKSMQRGGGGYRLLRWPEGAPGN